MIDIADLPSQVANYPSDKRCERTIIERGCQWACYRPEGHDGDHVALKLELRYFTDEVPTLRFATRSVLTARELREVDGLYDMEPEEEK